MTTRYYMDVRFDVTDLTEDDRANLCAEVMAQGEASDAHPEVEVEVEWNSVEPESDLDGMSLQEQFRTYYPGGISDHPDA